MLWKHGVVGSNPAIPTNLSNKASKLGAPSVRLALPRGALPNRLWTILRSKNDLPKTIARRLPAIPANLCGLWIGTVLSGYGGNHSVLHRLQVLSYGS